MKYFVIKNILKVFNRVFLKLFFQNKCLSQQGVIVCIFFNTLINVVQNYILDFKIYGKINTTRLGTTNIITEQQSFYIEKLRPKSVHLKKITEYNRKIVWFQKQQSRER